MVKDLTAQPRLEPLPSSSTFQPQKNFLEALDLEIFAHCVDYHNYHVIEISYEDCMRSYQEYMRNHPKKVRFALTCRELPASKFFQAQPEEFINIAPEEDPMVKDITAQPHLEPLPSISTFQPQKNFLEALDLEVFAYCADYRNYKELKTSYEDYMRGYEEYMRNSKKK